jgi:methyl-branched lipid omega-hydroxylase
MWTRPARLPQGLSVPAIVAVEEPAILRSAFVYGIKRLPVAWTPPA